MRQRAGQEQTFLESMSASDMPDGGKQGSQIDSLRKQRKSGNNVDPLSDLQSGQDEGLTKQQIKENKWQKKLAQKERKAEERRKKQAGPELLDVGSLLQKQQERKR